ncbi:amino acid permease [Caulobacter sp. SLTY]|uniref:amino acid permease n=1 Tax=Caulobacter sp. SLTY TaxID=2683262 RepID=UPI001412685D|nr:amino acid permease [Caulobacter sp. SLTY]NBB15217.1 amino acid permease [Caulobacter sp. SLTY]
MTEGKRMGPLLATFLVAGNMIGAGIYILPTSIAPFGTSSLVGWLVSAAGGIALAAVFAILGRLRPEADGIHAYARAALHPFLGFVTWFAYWVGCPLSNVAIGLAAVGYLTSLIPGLAGPLPTLLALMGAIWVFTLLNLLGPRTVTRLSGLALVLGLLPILAAIVLGLAAFNPELFAASWNPTGKPVLANIPGMVLLIFWAFLGMECANAVAAKVRNPERDIPIAAMGGIALAAVVYVAACVAVQGVIPPAELAKSTAPFADVVAKLAGPIAGVLVAIFAVVKTSGTLAGWILVTAETARAGAAVGYFPKLLTETDPLAIPRRGIIVTGVIMSAIALATASPTLAKQLNILIGMTVASTMTAYVLCCAALFREARLIGDTGRRLATQALAVGTLLFSAWVVWAWAMSS